MNCHTNCPLQHQLLRSCQPPQWISVLFTVQLAAIVPGWARFCFREGACFIQIWEDWTGLTWSTLSSLVGSCHMAEQPSHCLMTSFTSFLQCNKQSKLNSELSGINSHKIQQILDKPDTDSNSSTLCVHSPIKVSDAADFSFPWDGELHSC